MIREKKNYEKFLNLSKLRPKYYRSRRSFFPDTVYVSLCFILFPCCAACVTLTATLKPQSNGPLYSNSRCTVIGTLAVDGWAVTFGTARSDLGGLRTRPVSSSLYQM